MITAICCNKVTQEEPSHTHNHPHGEANAHMHQRPFEELVANFESPERIAWQKPDSVIALLGNISEKSIMDIGCGTGYFTVKLAQKGAKVICADVDTAFQTYVDERKQKEGYSDEQIETRLIPYDNPTLDEGEVDIVLIVDTYHHIEDRITYFQKVLRGLGRSGKLMVVDFIKEETPHGPPVEMRIDRESVIEELKQAGFSEFEVNENLLPYQYIILAE